MASSDRYDYFRRFLDHKVNQKISLEKIFRSMELEPLPDDFLAGDAEQSDIQCRRTAGDDLPAQAAEGGETLRKSDYLTSGNLKKVKQLLTDNWERILACYQEEQEAAAAYYGKVLKGCRKVVAVDIG